MAAKKTARQRAIIRRRLFVSCIAAVLVAAVALISFTVNSIIKSKNNNNPSSNPPSSGNSSSAAEPKEPYKTASATVLNTGDIMVHSTMLTGAKTANGYDFSAFFTKVAPHFKGADLSVANLEVTFGGTDSGVYSGYPAFNTPDSLADVIKESGLGLLLTSNNHCYDTGLFGLKRTLQVLKQRGIPYTGTKETPDEPYYLVKDVKGIKIGMVCYTFENNSGVAGRKSINGNIISTEANPLINSFSYENIDDFYASAKAAADAMKDDGADCTVFYMHWGNEYSLKPDTWQKSIAQRLCNLGVDVIVGGHPHVVQPIEMLHAEGGDNTTVCLYSMGNCISNQRQELMDSCPSGHTEDGVWFSYTFDKSSDGTTVLSAVDVIPTWVNKYPGGSGHLYTIYPLETADAGSALGLSGGALSKSAASYARTKELLAPGLNEIQTLLGGNVRFAD